MNTEYIGLVQCMDSGSPLLNMRVQMAAQPQDAPVPASISPISSECCEKEMQQKLSDFDAELDPDDPVIKRTAVWIVNQIKELDTDSVDKYNIHFTLYGEGECNVSIYCSEPPTTELIQRFSFGISKYTDPMRGPIVRIHIGGLFVNKKYSNVGSNLLEIVKTALKSMVNIGQLNLGVVELWSVETAVMFYIKNGFVVRTLFDNADPQQKVTSTHRILHFAMQEDNINIMKQYAKVTQDNFIEFINYLLEETKYGKYFKAYFDELDAPDDVEKSVMQSRFISSLFETSMIFKYERDVSKNRVTLKPLTV